VSAQQFLQSRDNLGLLFEFGQRFQFLKDLRLLLGKLNTFTLNPKRVLEILG
jgi:hypothetical protein